jgi:hypothetical protein
MSPNIDHATVAARIGDALERAEHRRTVNVARNAPGRAGAHPVREAVGHGLIAIGARIAGQKPMPDRSSLRRAA